MHFRLSECFCNVFEVRNANIKHVIRSELCFSVGWSQKVKSRGIVTRLKLNRLEFRLKLYRLLFDAARSAISLILLLKVNTEKSSSDYYGKIRNSWLLRQFHMLIDVKALCFLTSAIERMER